LAGLFESVTDLVFCPGALSSPKLGDNLARPRDAIRGIIRLKPFSIAPARIKSHNGGVNRKNNTVSIPGQVAIAVLASAVSASNEVQLLPSGQFRATDGRPKDVAYWFIDSAAAASIIQEIGGRDNRIVIDYEHQTLRTADNGQPAPAAGWFKKLEWREGDGLYAIDVEWTERASEHIGSKEYLYISPVFSYDKKTGTVKRILNAALTNNPALDGMDEVALMAASKLLNDQSQMEALTMDVEEILKQLRWMFNLPTMATAEEIMAELQKAVDKIKSDAPEEAAANFNLVGYLDQLNSNVAALNSEVVALKDATPDPAKYVSVDAMQAVQTELASLKKQVNDGEVEDLVTTALTEGKLLPAQESWARELGGKDIAELRAYLDTAQPIAPLTKTQTKGNPGVDPVGDLTEDELAICAQMGVSPDDYKKTKEATAG
jgi:phage I-like protein